jgi:hypothetical protein
MPRNTHGGDRKSEPKKDDADQVVKLPLGSLAEKAGVSQSTMQHAIKVREGGSAALSKAVESGQVTASDAASICDLPKSQQTEAVSLVQAGKFPTVREAAKTMRPRKRKPKKAGAAKIPVAVRKKLSKTLGDLIRQFDDVGLHDEFHECTNAMAKRLKTL